MQQTYPKKIQEFITRCIHFEIVYEIFNILTDKILSKTNLIFPLHSRSSWTNIFFFNSKITIYFFINYQGFFLK